MSALLPADLVTSVTGARHTFPVPVHSCSRETLLTLIHTMGQQPEPFTAAQDDAWDALHEEAERRGIEICETHWRAADLDPLSKGCYCDECTDEQIARAELVRHGG